MNKYLKGWIRKLRVWMYVISDKGIDIHSKGKWPSNELSNFFPHEFVLDGIKCKSMEGFLQALKISDPERQIEICALSGKEAKMRSSTDWKTNGILFWNGKEYKRKSKDFQSLIERAYKEMFIQNESFRKALKATKDKWLFHSIGNPKQDETILTDWEFCEFLTNLRKEYENNPS